MLLKRLSLVGFGLISIGICLLILSWLFSSETQSSVLETEYEVKAPCSETSCRSNISLIKRTEIVQITFPRRVSISDSSTVEFSYRVVADNKESDKPLDHEVKVRAFSSGFDLTPSDVITKSLHNNQRIKFSWDISPKRPGKHNVAFYFTGVSRKVVDNMRAGIPYSASDRQESFTAGERRQLKANLAPQDTTSDQEPIVYQIQVVDAFGLSARGGAIWGLVVSFAGAAITFPWIYERWEKRKETK